jgi:iron complex outermembrane receptor protein
MKLPFAVSPTPTFFVGCFALMLVSSSAHAAEATEKEFFEDLPVVLSVTRLAQSAHDTPGAVTVIDADMIRRSGARELADVLKMVPGFLVAHRRGGDTTASYHSAMDEFGARMQVYVDGRSVYSSFVIGDTHRGVAAVQLADVERVEVLRGSNSASYGSNAFLGVVNVVTKSPADTRGVSVAYGGGDAGISDSYARVGWGSDSAHWRLSTSRRTTTGFDGLYDDSRNSQVQLRGDINAGDGNDVSLDFGYFRQAWGDGVASKTCDTLLSQKKTDTKPYVGVPGLCDGNPIRTQGWRNTFAHLVWTRQLDATSSLRMTVGIDHELIEGDFVATQKPNVPLFLGPPFAFGTKGLVTLSLPFNASGSALRQDAEIQRTDYFGDWRTVVGAGSTREEVRSPFFYTTDASFSSVQTKLFASAEWKPSGNWTVNFSGLWEMHDYFGDNFAPRFGVNYHLDRSHTLRAGITRSFRYPSIYMYRGSQLLTVNVSPAVITSPSPLTIVSTLSSPYVAATGNVRPETLISSELGYLGEFREQNLRVDIRGFVERMKNRFNVDNADFVNDPAPTIRGLEYQLTWTPSSSTRVLFSEAHIRELPSDTTSQQHLEAPHRTGSLSVFHDFSNGVNVGVVDHYATPYLSTKQTKARQLDVRLGYNFRIGSTRAEAAIVTQSAAGSHSTATAGIRYDRRAFATLKLDF